MGSFAFLIRLVVLLGFIRFSPADLCDRYAAVGQSVTLAHAGRSNAAGLRWTHNKTIVFLRQQGRVSVGNQADVTKTGSLVLKKSGFSSAGLYEAHDLGPNGTLTNASTATRLCVTEAAPKPRLVYFCDYRSGAVKLDCGVPRLQGLTFSWTLDGQALASETRPTLSVSLSRLRGDGSFACSAANKAGGERSDPVRPDCKTTQPTPSPPSLFCLKTRTAAALLGGGSGLVAVLLAVVVALCCCRRRDRTRLRRRDVQLTRLSLSKRQRDSAGPVYETMHEACDATAAAPGRAASPESCYQNVSKPGADHENGPLQLAATAAEDQRPSPVPKPRTKAPQTTNN